MQNHPIIERKLANWVLVFNSDPHRPTQKTTILERLILGFSKTQQTKEEKVIAI